jgi:hypothetical protein
LSGPSVALQEILSALRHDDVFGAQMELPAQFHEKCRSHEPTQQVLVDSDPAASACNGVPQNMTSVPLLERMMVVVTCAVLVLVNIDT